MKTLYLVAFFLISALGFSQSQGTLKGTVLDQEMQNQPLLFANVQLKGSDLKTETNFHGNFEFETLESGDYTLVITYAGYENIKMPISIRPHEITQVNLAMVAKQISFEGIAGLESSMNQRKPVDNAEELQRK